MWIPISVTLANIQVVQTVELFGFVATLGNMVYATSFLVTDILSENYGKKEANKAVWIDFFSLIAVTVLMNLTLLFEPLKGDEFAQTTHEATNTIFSRMPRLAFAILTAYLLSQHHDVWAFHFWKNKDPAHKHLWLRNNASTMISQIIDSAIFVIIAFYGVFEIKVLFEVFLTTYFLKFIVAAADTPFVYREKDSSKSSFLDKIRGLTKLRYLFFVSPGFQSISLLFLKEELYLRYSLNQ